MSIAATEAANQSVEVSERWTASSFHYTNWSLRATRRILRNWSQRVEFSWGKSHSSRCSRLTWTWWLSSCQWLICCSCWEGSNKSLLGKWRVWVAATYCGESSILYQLSLSKSQSWHLTARLGGLDEHTFRLPARLSADNTSLSIVCSWRCSCSYFQKTTIREEHNDCDVSIVKYSISAISCWVQLISCVACWTVKGCPVECHSSFAREVCGTRRANIRAVLRVDS